MKNNKVLKNIKYFEKKNNLTLEIEEMQLKHHHLENIKRYSSFLPESSINEYNEFVEHFNFYHNTYDENELNNFQLREIEFINNTLSNIIDIDDERAINEEKENAKQLVLEQKKARSQGMASAIVILYITGLFGILAASALLLIR